MNLERRFDVSILTSAYRFITNDVIQLPLNLLEVQTRVTGAVSYKNFRSR